MKNTVIIPVRDSGGSGGGGSTVPVISAPEGDFYAAISYFTGENGDYDNYAYAYANNATEFTAQFCPNGYFANFTLHPTAGEAETVIIPQSKILGVYFGSLFDMTNIPDGFLYCCYTFNQPLTIPPGVTSIGKDFLISCCSFNQRLNLSGVTSVGEGFLAGNASFNQPLDISGLTNIGAGFLLSCYAFNQPLTLPDGFSGIERDFLSACESFNQSLMIPSSVTSIGSGFLSYCYAFSKPLTIPSGIASIGINFLYHCHSFNRLITNSSVSPTDNNSLSASINAAAYVNGIVVSGTGAGDWKAALPDRTASPYRKLILGNVSMDKIPVGTNIRGWEFEVDTESAPLDPNGDGQLTQMALNGMPFDETGSNGTGMLSFQRLVMAMFYSPNNPGEILAYMNWGVKNGHRFTIPDDQDYIVTHNNLPSGSSTEWGFKYIKRVG